MPDDLANIPGAEDPTARASLPFVSRLRIRGASAEGKAPDSTSPKYYLIREGRKSGPFKRDLVESLLRAGQSSPRDLGWQEGQTGWRPLGELLPGVNPLVRVPDMPVASVFREHPDERSFGALLFGSLAYPFRGDGVMILIAGAVALLGLNFAAGFFFLFSWIIGVCSVGYLFSALQIIIHNSALGEPELPPWPDIVLSRVDSLRPIGLWASTLLGCFGPALFAAALALRLEDAALTGLALALAVGGFLYYPMALLGVALTHSLAGMNPVLVACSISRIPGRYAAAVGLLLLVMVVQGTSTFMVDQMHSKVLGYLWNGFNAIYFAIVQARILGLLYYANRETLKWF